MHVLVCVRLLAIQNLALILTVPVVLLASSAI